MISIFAVGDTGASTSIRHKISKILQKQRKTAVLGLGDNFYNYGIDSVNSPRWKTDFIDAFKPDCPWYMVLGNHDYLGNIQAQMDFSLRNPYWKMPSRYYDIKIPLNTKDYIHLFCLDTFELCPEEAKLNSIGTGMSSLSWKTLESALKPQEQLNWFEKQLSSSKGVWKMVAGHYPIFSCGAHEDQPELSHRLLPLFHKYQVDFYVSGHDHNLQHTTCMETQLLVSGTGCSLSTIYPDKRFFKVPQVPGVSFFHFWNDKAKFGFLGEEGIIYEKTALPSRTRYCFSP